MNKNRAFFPIHVATKDDSNNTLFTNVMEGGVTFRDYVATEFMSALLANPAYVSNREATAAQLRGVAISMADSFIEELGE